MNFDSTSVDFSTLEGLAILLICVSGGVAGWRKILAGLSVFVVYEFCKTGGGLGDESINVLNLMAAILLWCGAAWIVHKIGSKFQKNPQPSVGTEGEELKATASSVQRVLAKTR